MTRSRKLLIIFFTAYTLMISYLCLKHPAEVTGFQIWDKAAHAITYTGFALQCCLIAASNRQLAVLFSFCFLFGIAMELLQGLTSYREASINDQLANAVGLITGYLLAYIIHRFYPQPAFHK